MRISFCREVTKEEVSQALLTCHHTRPRGGGGGGDGFHVGFYQHASNIVGEDITKMVDEFTRTKVTREGLNDKLIALVPKVKRTEKVNQLRPISLRNVNYKIITKVIMNRLKEFLGKIIVQEQCSFVPG